jgi:hypothetical protein
MGGKVWEEGDPAIVGRLALTDSWSLLARLAGGWRRLGVTLEVVLDEMEDDECVELSESTRRMVEGERADICIGGSETDLVSNDIESSTEPRV